MNNEELEILCVEIRSIANSLYFEQCSNDAFRQHFQTCVRSAVQQSKSQSFTTCNQDQESVIGKSNATSDFFGTYDAKILQSVLFYSVDEDLQPRSPVVQLVNKEKGREKGKLKSENMEEDGDKMKVKMLHRSRGIDWESLCNSHDANHRRKAHSHSRHTSVSVPTLTALEAVIDALVDTSIVPACYTHVIVHGLLCVCVEVFASTTYAPILSSSSSTASSSDTTIRANRPSSLKAIEIAITYLIQTRPSAMMSKSIGNYIKEEIMTSLSCNPNMKVAMTSKNDRELIQYLRQQLTHYDIDRTLMTLSIAKDLVCMKETRDRKGHRVPIKYTLSADMIIVRPVIFLLKELDEVDIYLLGRKEKYDMRRSKTRRADLCAKCRSQLVAVDSTESHRSKRAKTATLADLHGEASGEDNHGTVSPSSVGRYFARVNHNSSMLLPRKQIMAASSLAENVSQQWTTCGETCYVCSRKEGMIKYVASGITTLPLPMVHLRASLYQIIIDSARLSALEYLKLSASQKCSSVNPFVSMLGICIRHNQSASTRLCILLMAHQLGMDRGYTKYLKVLLNLCHQYIALGKRLQFQQKKGNHFKCANACLRIYHEVVKESAVFDNAMHFWRALQPLMDFVLDIDAGVDRKGTCPRQQADDGAYRCNVRIANLFLPCIGLLLMERHSIISANSSKVPEKLRRSFNGYVMRFSEKFGDGEDWVNDKMTSVERSRVALVLLKVGIISFLHDGQKENKGNSSENERASITYSTLHSLRGAHFRMGPKVKCDDLLTKMTGYEDNEEDSLRRKGRIRDRDEGTHPCGDPIVELINDDIIQYVFNFLGYKKLVQMTTICKSWRKIGNENMLWKQHFQKRFRPIFLEQFLQPSISPTIRSAFIHRYCPQQHKLSWLDLFRDKRNRERTLKGKVSKDGWKYQGCNVLNCKVIIRKKEDMEKHTQVHKRDVMKKIEIIQRAEERRRLQKLKKQSSKDGSRKDETEDKS